MSKRHECYIASWIFGSHLHNNGLHPTGRSGLANPLDPRLVAQNVCDYDHWHRAVAPLWRNQCGLAADSCQHGQPGPNCVDPVSQISPWLNFSSVNREWLGPCVIERPPSNLRRPRTALPSWRTLQAILQIDRRVGSPERHLVRANGPSDLKRGSALRLSGRRYHQRFNQFRNTHAVT